MRAATARASGKGASTCPPARTTAASAAAAVAATTTTAPVGTARPAAASADRTEVVWPNGPPGVPASIVDMASVAARAAHRPLIALPQDCLITLRGHRAGSEG